MATDAQIPLVLVRDLPVATGKPSARTQVVGVDGNGVTVRIPWDMATSQFLKASSVPTSPTSPGEQGALAVGASIYTYFNGVWGRTARYTQNWQDLDGSPRFLLVNKAMQLSETEKGNAWGSLGLQLATNIAPGLVQGSDSVHISDGVATVLPATVVDPGLVRITSLTTDDETGEAFALAASPEYVDTKVENSLNKLVPISPATSTQLGGILSSDTLAVDSTGRASVHVAISTQDKPGLVRIASTSPAGVDAVTHALWAAPVGLVVSLIENSLNNALAPATNTTLGAVVPTGALYIPGTTAGGIDARDASTTRKGVVLLIDAIPTDEAEDIAGQVPTAKAIRAYVQYHSPEVNLPIAGTSEAQGGEARPGVIMPSTTLLVDSVTGVATVPKAGSNSYGIVMVTYADGEVRGAPVPSTEFMKQWVNSHQADVPTASQDTAGTVMVFRAASEPATGTPMVPTKQYVDEKVSGQGGASSTLDTLVVNTQSSLAAATASSLNVSGNTTLGQMSASAITVSALASETIPDEAVLNYGQLKTLFQSLQTGQ